MQRLTFDVSYVIIKSVNVMLRKNVLHCPQLQPLEALRKRVKVMWSPIGGAD